MRSPVADLLGDLSRALATLNLPWYLFGAQAAIVYGAARLTADVDVTVRPSANAVAADWLPVFAQHGFEPRFGDRGFFAQTRVLPLVHRPTGLPTDVVLAGPGLEDAFLSRAVTRDLDGVAVPVIEITDLVILKVLAGWPAVRKTSRISSPCCASSRRRSTRAASEAYSRCSRAPWAKAIC